MTDSSKYIQISKSNPVFVAECDHFGTIERVGAYKPAIIEDHMYFTWDIKYTWAIVALHEWIQANYPILNEYPKAKFSIAIVDGSKDKHGEFTRKNVYSISSSKAKRLLKQP